MSPSNYKKSLFELLPQLYHLYDRGDGSLEAFLEAIGETLDDMERNIEELHSDSFIESCNDWVVPYIGRLIGARLVEAGGRNRQEVLSTIRWRRRKGNLEALEELASGVTGWGVRAAEFFEQIGWAQNLNHIRPRCLQSPDLKDHRALFLLGGSENRITHTVDIRKPCGQKGWFQTKNIGFFVHTAALSHYRKAPARRVFGKPGAFTIEPKRFPIDLYSGSGFPLSTVIEKNERFISFGLGQTVDIFSRGVLAATPELPEWTGDPKVAAPHMSLLDLKNNDGVVPADRAGSGGQAGFRITPMVLYESGGKAKLKSLGELDLSASPAIFKKHYDGSSKTDGRLVIRIEPVEGFSGPFPGLVLRLEGDRRTCNVFGGEEERRAGVYEDRMYCWLPWFCPAQGTPADFAIDRYGSSYRYILNGAKKRPLDKDLYDPMKLSRPTGGTIFPSRELTASVRPFRPIYSLSKSRPIQTVDRGQFLTASAPSDGWVVKAWNRNRNSEGVLRHLATIKVSSVSDKAHTGLIENHPVDTPGDLIVSLHRASAGRIPEMEVIVTDERGEAVLVYLPQIDDLDSAGAFFYVAEDGASYRVNSDSFQGGLVVKRTPESGPGGGFNRELLGRYSAGQVLPIEGISPIRHRVPIRCDLSRKMDVREGLLAIDPVIGMAAFAKGERPKMPVTVSYNHGLSTRLGAGAYHHGWVKVDEKRLLRVSKRSAPDGTRHLRPPADGVVSKAEIYGTIQEAMDEAARRCAQGSVEGGPLVIRVEDSAIYSEDIHISKAAWCGLVLQAAEFQRPLIRGRIRCDITDPATTPLLSFEGLTMGRTPRIRRGSFKEISFRDCTLLKNLFILKTVKGDDDRYSKLAIENCILRGRLSVNGYFEMNVSDSVLDNQNGYALSAERCILKVERATISGKLKAKELYASETIFTGAITVVDQQKGCVRYCRINGSGDALPYRYRCTEDTVTFCGTLPWRSDYLKLKRDCRQDAAVWAENSGEIGVYHRADYTLKIKKLMMKFEEYLPAGLTPAVINGAGC